MASNELFQYSVISALMEGIAHNGIDVTEVSSHGNLGLGTFTDLQGELIMLDGIVYRLSSNGTVQSIDGEEAKLTTEIPFVMVTRFEPTITSEVPQANSKEDLTDALSAILPESRNSYLVYRMDGHFKSLRVRTVGGQLTPHEKLVEVGKRQAEHKFNDIKGTLVGFRSPKFLQGISVAGDHLHFISEDRDAGGHVLDCTSTSPISVQAAAISKIHLELPRDKDYNESNLDLDAAGISSVEG